MHEPGLASRAWWKLHGRRFALTTASVATLVILVGWLTEAREVMHGALVFFAVAALLPFVVIAAGLALVMFVTLMCAVAAALSDGGGDLSAGLDGSVAVVEGGGWMVPRYYRFLARRKHPVFWGAGAGVLLGGIILWVALAIIVMPGEARTTDNLIEARVAVGLHYATHGELPRPDAEHRLVIDGKVFEDGYGRALDYRVVGVRKLALWKVRSFGYDGEPDGDDLCADGGTPVVEKVAQAAELLKLGQRARSLGERLESIRSMRCER